MDSVGNVGAPRLTVRHQRCETALVLHVAGELDAATTEVLQSALQAAIETESDAVVLDLAEVTFIDSEGVGTLLSGSKRARDQGIQLLHVVSHPQVREVLAITGVARVLAPYTTVEEALAKIGDQDDWAS